jgi:hypothetical protein
MTLIEKFEQEILRSNERILFKDTACLGHKTWQRCYDFSVFDSTLYVTNNRLAIVTEKPSAIVKGVYKALASLAGSSLDLPVVRSLGKQAVDLNPNEGNVLNIPFPQIKGVEYRDKTLIFIPASIVVLNFSDGTELPMMFRREAGDGAERWDAPGRARAFLNSVNQQRAFFNLVNQQKT